MRETAKVVLLASNAVPEVGELFLAMGFCIRQENDFLDEDDKWGQHLYFVTKGEINEGDYIHTINIPVEKVKSVDRNRSTQKGYEHLYYVEGSGNQYKPVEVWGKIVATTDKALGLPLISKEFLKQYVASQGAITKVTLDGVTVISEEQLLLEAAESMFTTQKERLAFITGATWLKEQSM